MKKSSKSSLKKKKRSLDISLQHKKEASYKFSKKNFCTWPKKGLELKGLTLSVQQDVTNVIKTRSRLRVWVGIVQIWLDFRLFFVVL